MISPSNKSLVTFGHLEFLEMCLFFVFLDYAVSISLKTNCLKKKTILYKKAKHWPFVKINIHLQEEFQSMNETTYLTVICTNHVGLLRHIFSNQTLETTNHWLRGYH